MTKLFWFSRKHLKRDNVINFGDELSKYLVEKITGKKVKWINPKSQNFLQKKFSTHVLGIGSILHFGADNSLIWGSGLIEKKSFVPSAKFFAVRGKFTRNELLNRGFKVPDVFGDPGLLTPLFFPSHKNPTKKIGIIPHYIEFDEVKNWFKYNNISDEFFLIDLRKNVNDVIKYINDCSMILSSSLHGIIVPQAYGIPTLRVSFTNKIYGDDIKYKDYFSSVDIPDYKHISLNKNNISEKLIIEYFNGNMKYSFIENNLQKIQDRLIEVKPF